MPLAFPPEFATHEAKPMMRIPAATYRLQFNPDFGFDAAAVITPYLAELGISDIYASPILTPRHGSQHGYDVVDCHMIKRRTVGWNASTRSVGC